MLAEAVVERIPLPFSFPSNSRPITTVVTP
jgi:hypothetical protein